MDLKNKYITIDTEKLYYIFNQHDFKNVYIVDICDKL